MERENFQKKVYSVVKKIPKGKILTYKQVAERVGNQRAWRAVGNVLNKNVDFLTPCHRVVCSNGLVGGYKKGVKKKIEILRKEGIFSKGKILPSSFFNRPCLSVAKSLLGKFLIKEDKRVINGFFRCPVVKELMITEVEAYVGLEDKASHASRGKTERNKIMFGPAGCWYVYFTYGLHWMLNVVTGPKGFPAAVLIRGTGRIVGPARITKYLKITKRFNGLPASKKAGLWIEDRGVRLDPRQIAADRRVGVEYAGEWADKPYRFRISD